MHTIYTHTPFFFLTFQDIDDDFFFFFFFFFFFPFFRSPSVATRIETAARALVGECSVPDVKKDAFETALRRYAREISAVAGEARPVPE